MNGTDDQALLLGSLVGLSLATAGGVTLIWWWFRRA